MKSTATSGAVLVCVTILTLKHRRGHIQFSGIFILLYCSCSEFVSFAQFSAFRFLKHAEPSDEICMPKISVNNNWESIVPLLKETTLFRGPFLSHLPPFGQSWGLIPNSFNKSLEKWELRVQKGHSHSANGVLINSPSHFYSHLVIDSTPLRKLARSSSSSRESWSNRPSS